MQPFLSGETTLALLLTILTLLFFAAAGDEHPYEPYSHKPLPVEAGRSSAVELTSPQIIKGQELAVRLKGLQVHHQREGTGEEEQQQQQQQQQQKRRSAELTVGRPRSSPKPRLSTITVITSRLRSWPRRNLQILAALLSHRSLHTASLSPLLLNSKSDMSWSLEALLGLGLAAKKTTTTTIPGRSPLRCRAKKRVRFVEGGEKKKKTEVQQQQLQGWGGGWGRKTSVGDERVVVEVCC